MNDASTATSQQFILLPGKRLMGGWSELGEELHTFLASIVKLPVFGNSRTYWIDDPRPVAIRVLDIIPDEGPILTEMLPESASNLRAHFPDLTITPVSYFRLATSASGGRTPSPLSAGGRPIRLRVVSSFDRSPVAGATVAVTVDPNTDPAVGVTDTNGVVNFPLETNQKDSTRTNQKDGAKLFISPLHSYWNRVLNIATLRTGIVISVTPINLAHADALRYFYPNVHSQDGDNVRVGVIDSGIASHPDLRIAGGANLSIFEDPNDYGDNGTGHGTHVAGIIAANGTPPNGLRGLAPAVQLYSYRVCAQGEETASDWSIAKGLLKAVADGCDLISISAANDSGSDIVRRALVHAHNRGTLVVAAAGNGGRQPVAFPAREPLCLAVSAMGRKGTFPQDSAFMDEIAPPNGADRDNFVATFTNSGQEIALTAPGVAIISTVPGGYQAMSGTSTACPAVVGAAARFLGSNMNMLQMVRNARRTSAIRRFLLSQARSLGFSPEYEGQGMLNA